MIAGMDHLRRAGEILARERAEVSRAALLDAADEYWKAAFYARRWPSGLQAAAAEVNAVLFRYGPIHDSVPRLNGAELAEARSRILALLAAAEAHLSRTAPRPEPPQQID